MSLKFSYRSYERLNNIYFHLYTIRQSTINILNNGSSYFGFNYIEAVKTFQKIRIKEKKKNVFTQVATETQDLNFAQYLNLKNS